MTTPRLKRHTLAGAIALVGGLLIAGGVAFGVSGGGPVQLDPDSLVAPQSIPRHPWVRADGTIDQSRLPAARQDWALANNRVDCTRAPRTVSIATFDGGILLDAAGREVQMPALTGCDPAETPEFSRAWVIRATRMQEADARRRGIPIPAPPTVEVSPAPALPAGGIVDQESAR